MQNAIAVKVTSSDERLLIIARELRRLAGAAYGSPVRVPVTPGNLRGIALEIESIVEESQTEHPE
jgi:hypothetical protein